MGEIVMPRLSDTMEEGTILRWLKRDGEQVSRGTELVEIETDKATMVYESDQEGTLHTIANEGDTLAVGELIASVDGQRDSDATPSGAGRQALGAGARSSSPATPDSDRVPAAAASPAAQPSAGERVKASPLAKRMARERGVDLGALTGSGPGGRIVKADVQAAGADTQTASRERVASSADVVSDAGVASAAGVASDADVASREHVARAADVASAKGSTTVVELTRTQQTIARRMAESKATIPDFTLRRDVDMQACVELRSELKRFSQPAAPTYNDMVVKACALALREHARVNSSYRDGALQLHSRVNVGVAVAAQEALVVPTVFDADEKSLGEIARETRTLAARVRDATITPPELSGGTFTVSNLGMHGVDSFTAIINPPQAAILSVGSVKPRAVMHEGEVRARHTMTLTLACDHRVLYGAEAAQFLARVCELLETPAALTL